MSGFGGPAGDALRRRLPWFVAGALLVMSVLNVVPAMNLSPAVTWPEDQALQRQATDELDRLAAEHGNRKIRQRYGFYLNLREYVKHHELVVPLGSFVNVAEALGFARADVVVDDDHAPDLTASEAEALRRHASVRGEFVDGTPYIVVGLDEPSALREYRFEGTVFFVSERFADA